jgi:hypothetical protein
VVKKTFAGQGLVGRVFSYEHDGTEVREIVEGTPGLVDGMVSVVNPKTGERGRENLGWVLRCLGNQPDGAQFEGVCDLLSAACGIDRVVKDLAGEVLRSEHLPASADILHDFHVQTLALIGRMKAETERLIQARLAKDFDEELVGRLLYHVTNKDNARAILKDGFNAGACFTDQLDLVDYYWGTVEDEGGEPVVLRVSLDEVLSAVPDGSMVPDMPSIDEPITTVIGKSEQRVQDEWLASSATWKDALRISGGVKCMATIPANVVSLDDDDVDLEPIAIAP